LIGGNWLATQSIRRDYRGELRPWCGDA